MKQTKIIMGMPIMVEIVDKASPAIFKQIFDYFKSIDDKFSTYKKTSEISLFNQGKISRNQFSQDMKTVFRLSEKTKQETNGFFDIFYQGHFDPSGLVKGWAIWNASKILKKAGLKNFYISAGGDIQTSGVNNQGQAWIIGIKSPFNQQEIIKVVNASNLGVATSGTYIRGDHIYRPADAGSASSAYNPTSNLKPDLASLTVIGPNIYEADRFATACFAMDKQGIEFIEKAPGLEGYMIDTAGLATLTSGFEQFTIKR
jgi:FAD:protein FMN transferase